MELGKEALRPPAVSGSVPEVFRSAFTMEQKAAGIAQALNLIDPHSPKKVVVSVSVYSIHGGVDHGFVLGPAVVAFRVIGFDHIPHAALPR